jgi:hypothetical protein
LLAGCGDSSASSGSVSRSATERAEAHKGGEASIEEFGSEVKGSDREQILAAFTGYLDALAERKYDAACTYHSAAVRE